MILPIDLPGNARLRNIRHTLPGGGCARAMGVPSAVGLAPALHDQVTNLTALVALELVQCSWETDGRSTVRSVGR